MALVTKIANWAFAALLVLIGGYLAIRGIELISLGGAKIYLLKGAVAIAVGALLALRQPWTGRIYAGLLLLVVVWSVWEAGFDLMALLPRVWLWLALGVWFVTPWYSAYMRGDEETSPVRGDLIWVGGAGVLGVLLLGVGALQGYRVEEGTRVEVASAPAVTDWKAYGNSPGGTRFAEVTQVNVDNVGELEEAWRFRTGVPFDFKNTPLMVGDLLYTCTAGNIIIALDAATGEEVWRHDTQTDVPGANGDDLSGASTFARSCRGLGYYEAPADYEGECRERIVAGTVDARLLTIDAITGRRCISFGAAGEVNLKSGLRASSEDVPTGQFMVTSMPLVAGNVAVVGGWVTDNQELGNVSGLLRAYDVITGAFVWAWDMGNPGYHGLPDEGDEYTRGTPNVWSTMSYDPELDLVFAPTGNASPDYFGAKRRPFDEEYSAAVVALRAQTGEPAWHYQTVHHDIWDWDVPSQPTLMDLNINGEEIPVVVQPTKRGEVFVLDRRTGEPVWPATECPDGSPARAGGECPVPQGPIEGEWVAETQPFSALPHFRPDRWEKDMWGVSPLDQLYCRIEYKKMRYEGHFTPPMRGGGGPGTGEATYGGTFQYPGNAGGFNWPSVSVDVDNGLLVATPMLMGNRIVMVTPAERMAMFAGNRPAPPPRDEHEAEEGADDAPPQPARAQAPRDPDRYTDQGEWDPELARYGLTAPFMSNWKLFGLFPTNIPCFEPPYGRMAVIDLNQNKLLWSRPIGTMREMAPFGIQPNLPFHVGTPIYGGTMTTRGGLIFQVGTMDSTIRAVDIRTGKVKWSERLPGTANGTPMTYIAPSTGKQYVVIVVPNPGFVYPRDGSSEPSDDQGGYVIAYALPDDA